MEKITVNINPHIFKKGKLILVSFSIWPGSVKQDAEEFLSPFTNMKNSFVRKLDMETISSPLPQTRMVPLDRMEAVRDLMREVEANFNELTQEKTDAYPAVRDSWIEQFNLKHPESRGALDKHYPTPEEFSSKFGVEHMFFEMSDLNGIDDVINEEREHARQRTIEWTERLAREFRRTTLQACLAFKTGMERAKAKVDERAVKAFKNFLDRYRTNNFMEDQQMDTMLSSMQEQIFKIDNWEVGENLDLIFEHLNSVIAIAQQEGEATEIASSFIDRVSELQPTEMMIEQPAISEDVHIESLQEIPADDSQVITI